MNKNVQNDIYILEQLGANRLDEVLHLEEQIFSTPWSKEQYASLMGAGVCKLFGATERATGYLVAYAAVSVNIPACELEIYNIAVRQEARRQGLARRLTGLVLEAARTLHLERALLEVRESNTPARHLYEGLGFKECGMRRDYYTEPVENAVLYEYSFL